MAKSPSTPPGDDEKKKIANADWLLGDAPQTKSKSKPAQSRPDADVDHSYDLAEGQEDPSADEAASPPIPAASAPRRSRPKIDSEGMETDMGMGMPAEAPARSEYVDTTPTVDQVWTRGGEWGGHCVVLGLVAALFGFLAYVAFAGQHWFVSFLILMGGGAVLLVLCYPLFITLERPVRITPEQAAKDYYAMLSYIWPFYPRMWLLLSSAGRKGPEFSSYGEFQRYWKRTLAKLQGGMKATSLNPLRFRVDDFRSEKSAGATAVTAKFTVRVFRGEPGTGKEVASFLVSTGLVKGPDRMWYLNSGTLPNERR